MKLFLKNKIIFLGIFQERWQRDCNIDKTKIKDAEGKEVKLGKGPKIVFQKRQ